MSSDVVIDITNRDCGGSRRNQLRDPFMTENQEKKEERIRNTS